MVRFVLILPNKKNQKKPRTWGLSKMAYILFFDIFSRKLATSADGHDKIITCKFH
jgi:hypothetical protein